jgi:hypothetical protein
LSGRVAVRAPGWNFRAVLLEKELILTSDGGAAKIIQGELGNTGRLLVPIPQLIVQVEMGAGDSPRAG